MKLCEARRIGVNLKSFQKYGNVNQEAGPENKDGQEKEEGRRLVFTRTLCVRMARKWTFTVIVGVSPSDAESGVLGCELAPRLHIFPSQDDSALFRERNKSANALRSWPDEMFVGGKGLAVLPLPPANGWFAATAKTNVSVREAPLPGE